MYYQLNENIKLCGTSYGEYLMYFYNKDGMNYQEINKEGYEILSLCDGSNSYEDIVDQLAKYYNESKDKVKENISEFINLSLKLNILKEVIDPLKKTKVQLNENIYTPTALFMTIELTKKCNLYCSHCYANAGINQTKELDLSLLKNLISYAETSGTLLLQFTGGETFMYSEINQLLKYAVKNFTRRIEISTNGTIWNETIEEILANKNYSQRVSFQVSIDGLEKFHDNFRGVQGSYKKTMDFIKKVKAINPNTFITVAITLANQQYNDVMELAEIVSNSGVDRLRIGVVTDQGRAEGTSMLKWNVKKYRMLLHELFDKYKDKKMQIAYENDDECMNCGAGYKIIALLSDNTLRPCIMHKRIIGKVYTLEDYKSLIINSIEENKNLKAPNKKYCEDCEYCEECNNCFANAEINRKKVKMCKWYESTYK